MKCKMCNMKCEIGYEMGNEAQTVTQRNQPEGDGNITWKLNSGNYFMWPWGGNLNIRVTEGLLKYVSWQSFCEPVALGITVHSLRKSNISSLINFQHCYSSIASINFQHCKRVYTDTRATSHPLKLQLKGNENCKFNSLLYIDQPPSLLKQNESNTTPQATSTIQ